MTRNKPNGAVKVLHLLYNLLARAFYRWAMREISPLHPDVPKIMARQVQLQDKWRELWT